MEKVDKVPARHSLRKTLYGVVLPKDLHSHDGKDEDDDTENKTEVTQCVDCSTDYSDQKVQGWP